MKNFEDLSTLGKQRGKREMLHILAEKVAQPEGISDRWPDN